MAGTPTAFDPTKVAIGPCWLWVLPAPPGAGAYVTLFSDGTPDATAYPSGVKFLGHTDGGAKFKDGLTTVKINADESLDPIIVLNTGGAASLSFTALQVADTDLLVQLSPGRATKVTATGKEGITGGTTAIAYSCVLCVFKTVADPTKFHYICLYKALNTAGVEIDINSKAIAKSPVTFEALGITSRAATDTTYQAVKQV